MTLSAFLGQLAETGLAAVSAEPAIDSGADTHQLLRAWDEVQRGELAFSAPALSLPAAEWAAMRLYEGCQALACREMGPEDLRQRLRIPCPEPPSAATAYSVDLALRFLPDLVALARRFSVNDPLVAELLTLAQQWPLSSVGIEGVGAVDAALLLGHPGLRQLYLDRILVHGDTARLQDSAVKTAVRISLGAFGELAPLFTDALATSP